MVLVDRNIPHALYMGLVLAKRQKKKKRRKHAVAEAKITKITFEKRRDEAISMFLLHNKDPKLQLQLYVSSIG